MIGETALAIARVLAAKKSRATYEQVGQAIGWGHPTGRGLGKHLYELLHYCKDNNLPPLTTILVKKGEKLPARDSMKYITQALGNIDIEKAQRDVFAFEWRKVPEFAAPELELPLGKPVWLTSFWGFTPESWGCVGFADEGRRKRFLRESPKGALVAIYVTKHEGPDDMRGKVVGLLEVSTQIGHTREFISGDQWVRKEADPKKRGKWMFAVRAIRAWWIDRKDWVDVETLLPKSYASANPQFIGGSGVLVPPDEALKLLELNVVETKLHGETGRLNSGLQTFGNVLKPTKAVYPAKEPYWVGETDGSKYLYILKLTGDIATYLARTDSEVEGKCIVKVGFSKSPFNRRDQIQSAYPDGSFKWEVLWPKEIPAEPPYPNAEVAIAGEDAMKARLQGGDSESLGGEFFLAEESFVGLAWGAGLNAASKKKADFELK